MAKKATPPILHSNPEIQEQLDSARVQLAEIFRQIGTTLEGLADIQTIREGLHQTLTEQVKVYRDLTDRMESLIQRSEEVVIRLEKQTEENALQFQQEDTKGIGFWAFVWKLRSSRARNAMRKLLAVLVGETRSLPR